MLVLTDPKDTVQVLKDLIAQKLGPVGDFSIENDKGFKVVQKC